MKQSHKVMLIGLSLLTAIFCASGFSLLNAANRQHQEICSNISDNQYQVDYVSLQEVSKIDVSGKLDVVIENADVAKIEFNQELPQQANLRTWIVDKELHIEPIECGANYNTHLPDDLKVTVFIPGLQEISASGSTKINFTNFSGNYLEIKTSGSSKITGKQGHYKEIKVKTSGASEIDLSKLSTESAEVKGSGSSKFILQMGGGTLSGKLSGSSNLVYSGVTSKINVSTSGSSTIEKRE